MVKLRSRVTQLQKSYRCGKLAVLLGIIHLSSSCCSIVIPPVTLTGNKTAIEKQIIGEKTEIEENVWLISSASISENSEILNSTAVADNQRAKLENEYAARAFIILRKYQPEVELLIKDNVLGESIGGNLVNMLEVLPEAEIDKSLLEKYNTKYIEDIERGKPVRRLEIVPRQVNYARQLLCKSFLVNQGKETFKDEEVAELMKEFGRQSIKNAKPGMYIEKSAGSWSLLLGDN